MKVKYQDRIAQDALLYPEAKQKIKTYGGYEFKVMGKSYEKRSLPWRLLQTVIVVGLVALGLLLFTVPFFFTAFNQQIKIRAKEIWKGKEKILYYLPTTKTIQAGQEDAKKIIRSFLKDEERCLFNHEKDKNPVLPKTVKVFVKADFGTGAIKTSVLFNSGDNAPLNQARIAEEIARIQQTFEKDLETKLGMPKKCHLVVIWQDAQNQLHGCHHHNLMPDYGRNETRGGLGYWKGSEVISKLYQNYVVEYLGFTKEDILRQGELI